MHACSILGEEAMFSTELIGLGSNDTAWRLCCKTQLKYQSVTPLDNFTIHKYDNQTCAQRSCSVIYCPSTTTTTHTHARTHALVQTHCKIQHTHFNMFNARTHAHARTHTHKHTPLHFTITITYSLITHKYSQRSQTSVNQQQSQHWQRYQAGLILTGAKECSLILLWRHHER